MEIDREARVRDKLIAAMERLWKIAAWLSICAGCCIGLRADSLAGYTRHLWQAADGLLEQTVQAIAQTPDGYLWIGTTGGLLRFDGVHFKVFSRQNTPAIYENSVFCLTVSHDGALWIGTDGGGLVRYAQGHFRSWTTKDGLGNDFVRAIFEDADGSIWAGTDSGLFRLKGERFVRVDGTPAIPTIAVHAIFRDRAGRLWVGGSALLWVQGTNAKAYSVDNRIREIGVKTILQTSDGTIWVGTVFGLSRMRPGHESFERFNGLRGTVRVLRQTSDDMLWIGTIGKGIFQYKNGALAQITAPAQLPSNTVLNLFEDAEKNYWIGTQAGLVRLTSSPMSIVPLPQANDADFGTIYRDRDGSFWIGSALLIQMKDGVLVQRTLPGMSGVHVRNVYRDRSGVLWAGTDGEGLFRISGDHTTRITTRDGLSSNFIRVITQSRDGSIWVGTDGCITHIFGQWPNLHVISTDVRDGLVYTNTRDLFEDSSGDLWIGTDRGLSHMHSGAFVVDVAVSTLAQFKVWAIHEDRNGGLWFGTRDNGLFHFRDGKMAHYTQADGLASDAVYQIVEDGAGRLWMSGPNGISVVNRSELDAHAESQRRHLALTFYPTSDISADTQIYGGTQSSGCITPDGVVWFPSNKGPVRILPTRDSSLPPPPLHIQSVIADGVQIPTVEPIVLSPGIGRLEFSFAPIRLRSQEGLRFSYMLDGFDRDWGAATSVRTADYTNLPSGWYRFRVRTFEVSNPNSVTETSIEVFQRPHFYRSWWFTAACILLFIFAIYLVHLYQVRQVRAGFEAVVEERSRLGREIHDTVLQGCTGASALLEALSMEIENNEGGNHLLNFARLQLGTTIDEAREAVWDLRRPECDAKELGEKLEAMTRKAAIEFNLPITFSASGTPCAVSNPIVHDLLMVGREAVYNAVLHGSPKTVEVTLTYDRRELILCVVDDGCGFDSPRQNAQNGHHFGLKGMRERTQRWGGQFRLASEIGKGVRVEARISNRQ
jgi:ligand-binding sensor domain-containing protein/signal transduction histidine kinase